MERLTPHLADREESAVRREFPASHIQLDKTHQREINLKQVSLQITRAKIPLRFKCHVLEGASGGYIWLNLRGQFLLVVENV